MMGLVVALNAPHGRHLDMERPMPKSALVAIFLLVLGCVAAEPPEHKGVVTAAGLSREDVTMEIVKALHEHLLHAGGRVFHSGGRIEDFISYNKFQISLCKEGYHVDFSPRNNTGLDGNLVALVSRDFTRVDPELEIPTECEFFSSKP